MRRFFSESPRGHHHNIQNALFCWDALYTIRAYPYLATLILANSAAVQTVAGAPLTIVPPDFVPSTLIWNCPHPKVRICRQHEQLHTGSLLELCCFSASLPVDRLLGVVRIAEGSTNPTPRAFKSFLTGTPHSSVSSMSWSSLSRC